MDVEPIEAIIGVALIVAVTWGLFMVYQASGTDLLAASRDKAESISHTVAFSMMVNYYWNNSSSATPSAIINEINNFLDGINSYGTWVNLTLYAKDIKNRTTIWNRTVYTSPGNPSAVATNMFSFVPVNATMKATPNTTTLWIRTSSDKYNCADLNNFPIVVYFVPLLPDGSVVGGTTSGSGEYSLDVTIKIDDKSGGGQYEADCTPFTDDEYFINGIFACKFQTTDNLCYLLGGQPSTQITVEATLGYIGEGGEYRLLAEGNFTGSVLSNDNTARFTPPDQVDNAFFLPYEFTVRVESTGPVSGDYRVKAVFKDMVYDQGTTPDGTITVILPPDPDTSTLEDLLRAVPGLYLIEFDFAPDNKIYRPFIVYPYALDVEVQVGVGG